MAHKAWVSNARFEKYLGAFTAPEHRQLLNGV
jgi:hypothetical protein